MNKSDTIDKAIDKVLEKRKDEILTLNIADIMIEIVAEVITMELTALIESIEENNKKVN